MVPIAIGRKFKPAAWLRGLRPGFRVKGGRLAALAGMACGEMALVGADSYRQKVQACGLVKGGYARSSRLKGEARYARGDGLRREKSC